MTVKPVVRAARADLDVLEAIDRYVEEAAHAVDGFVDALEDAYRRLARDLGLGSPRHAHELDMPGLRHWRCRKFPYLLFYQEADDRILILRVLHAQRDVPLRMRDADRATDSLGTAPRHAGPRIDIARHRSYDIDMFCASEVAAMSVAKLFTHGGSQAVRLPKEFRFEGTEVHVRRVGDEVVLSAHPPTSVQALIDALDAFEPGLRLQREQPAVDRRSPIRPKR